MDFEKRAGQFRRAVAQRGPVGPRRRYTPELRAMAIAYAKERVGTGGGFKAIARELGVGRFTLRGWVASAEQSAQFRTVELTDDAPRDQLVVHGPGGVRIEGLDLAGVAELLRRLR